MNNDLHIKTVALCLVIILGICAIFWDKLFIILPILICCLGVAFYKKYFSKRFILILLLSFLLTIVYAKSKQPTTDVLSYYDKHNIEIEGRIISLPDKTNNGKTKFIFNVKNITDNNISKPTKAKTLVYVDKNFTQKISRGDNLKIQANIVSPKTYSNPGEFDYGKYLSNFDIYTLAFSKNVTILPKEKDYITTIQQSIDNIREKIILEHSKYLKEEYTQILGGIVFGSEAIKPSTELKTTFINSGLYHLLAASGMNVAFIFGIWFFILIRLKVPYKFIIISGGIVVFFYALMTGLPPSVTRATWMLELGLLAKLLDRKADNNVILLFVCAILLIYNPKFINDIGFLLSFMVTFGLLSCTNPILEKIKFVPAKISGWIIIPCIAQIFAIPIQIYYFQTISVYSILANIIVIPFMAFISFCGFVSSILALIPKIGTYICFVLDKVNEPFLYLVLFVAEKISNLPNNIAYVAKLNCIEIILYYILVILFVYMLKNNFKNIKLNITSAIVLILLLCNFALKSYSNSLEFTFFNVGEADSILINTPNNKKILVDTGKRYNSKSNSATSIILPFLKMNGITNIDIMLLTHPDSDHIGGSVDILKNIKVDLLITNGEKAKNKSFFALHDLVNQTHQPQLVINKPQEISPDEEVSIIAFKPPNTNDKNQNDTSIILLLKYKDFDGILMGDNESNSYELLQKYLKPNGEVELFKIGHHGSKNSVNDKMAKLISPEVTIVSVGENSYGHPNQKALSRLVGSRIYRTDMDNTVRIKTNGKSFDVYTYNPKISGWEKSKK